MAAIIEIDEDLINILIIVNNSKYEGLEANIQATFEMDLRKCNVKLPLDVEHGCKKNPNQLYVPLYLHSRIKIRFN